MREIKISNGYKRAITLHNAIAKVEKGLVITVIGVSFLKIGTALVADYLKKRK